MRGAGFRAFRRGEARDAEPVIISAVKVATGQAQGLAFRGWAIRDQGTWFGYAQVQHWPIARTICRMPSSRLPTTPKEDAVVAEIDTVREKNPRLSERAKGGIFDIVLERLLPRYEDLTKTEIDQIFVRNVIARERESAPAKDPGASSGRRQHLSSDEYVKYLQSVQRVTTELQAMKAAAASSQLLPAALLGDTPSFVASGLLPPMPAGRPAAVTQAAGPAGSAKSQAPRRTARTNAPGTRPAPAKPPILGRPGLAPKPGPRAGPGVGRS